MSGYSGLDSGLRRICGLRRNDGVGNPCKVRMSGYSEISACADGVAVGDEVPAGVERRAGG